jgi:ATP-dependent helicase HrpA
LSYGQQALEQLGDIYIQWQQIRRQLLVLDPDVFDAVSMILKIS